MKPHRKYLFCRLDFWLGLGVLPIAFSAHAQTPKANDRPTRVFSLSDQLIYDDNLYRLPEDVDPASLIGSEPRREDYLNRLSAAFNGEWQISRQAILLSLQVADLRFQHNDALNHVSTKNRLGWQWVVGSRLAGALGAEYSRSLANFANNLVLERDILESQAYFGQLRFRMGNHWRLKVTGRQSDIDHSLATRRLDNSSTVTGTGGIEYETSSRNILGWDYRYVDGRFPEYPSAFSGQRSIREYIERGALGRIEYALSAKTSVEGSAGYLRRKYPQDPASDFSGNVWRAGLQWKPTAKVQWSLSGWRELRANQDAESDYFVSRGVGAGFTWLMRETLEFSIDGTSERRQYLLATGVAGIDGRRDDVESVQSLLAYKPRRWLELNTSFGYERRDSNRDLADYNGWIAGLGVKTLF